MQKLMLALFAALALAVPASAQTYFTRDAKVKFFSDAKVEDIEAVNKSGSIIVNTKTGEVASKVLIQNFLFEKALMQEHFNENYMESGKYPNASFKGSIANAGEVNFGKDGTYKARVKGKLNIHGTERDVEIPATITVGGGDIKVHSDFSVKCSDYGIKIEAQKVSNIASDIAVTIDGTLKPKS